MRRLKLQQRTLVANRFTDRFVRRTFVNYIDKSPGLNFTLKGLQIFINWNIFFERGVSYKVFFFVMLGGAGW